ncbi:YSIRK-type signal peptide-containing protein [Staphylococcus agnetis]|uniref:YSIRK-type signal peptide-containing protein n=1 Tax=Staphylococcus agnetis TaxID=985762 RepID=UPI00164950A3
MINKQRYGIRKYKIGAASIALGTMVVIGVNETTKHMHLKYKCNIQVMNLQKAMCRTMQNHNNIMLL